MSKREKIELRPALKAQNYKEGDVVKATAFIKDIEDVQTKFGESSVITFEDGDSIFMNDATNNNLVAAFGNEDEIWKGKAVRVVCEKNKVFDKLMLVAYAVK